MWIEDEFVVFKTKEKKMESEHSFLLGDDYWPLIFALFPGDFDEEFSPFSVIDNEH